MNIKYNFSENSAYINIIGNDFYKKYLVQFYNLESNYLVYQTYLSENNWASSSDKTDTIRVYLDDNLIFEKKNR